MMQGAYQFVHGQRFAEPQVLEADRRHASEQVIEHRMWVLIEALGDQMLAHPMHVGGIHISGEHRGDLVP